MLIHQCNLALLHLSGLRFCISSCTSRRAMKSKQPERFRCTKLVAELGRDSAASCAASRRSRFSQKRDTSWRKALSWLRQSPSCIKFDHLLSCSAVKRQKFCKSPVFPVAKRNSSAERGKRAEATLIPVFFPSHLWLQWSLPQFSFQLERHGSRVVQRRLGSCVGHQEFGLGTALGDLQSETVLWRKGWAALAKAKRSGEVRSLQKQKEDFEEQL